MKAPKSWFITFNSCFSLRNQTGSLRSLQWARGAGEVRSDVLGTPVLAGHCVTDPALFPNLCQSVGARHCCGSSNENQQLHTPVCGWCRHAGPMAWLRHLLFPGPSLDPPGAALHRLLHSQVFSRGFCSSSEFFALEKQKLWLGWSRQQFSNWYLSVRCQVRSFFWYSYILYISFCSISCHLLSGKAECARWPGHQHAGVLMARVIIYFWDHKRPDFSIAQYLPTYPGSSD